MAGPTALAFFSGGFFERPRVIAAIAVWAAVAVAALVARRPLPRSRAGRSALLGLALLTAWTAISYEWAPLGERTQADIQRLLLYLGFLAAATGLLRGPIARRWVEPAAALGTLTVVAYGLSARLLPSLLDFARSTSAEGRLEQPLTYWNAMGCLAAIGVVLCVRIAGDVRHARWVRIASGLAGPVLVLGTYLSFSRGAILALGAGLALLVVLAPSSRVALRVAAVTLATGAGAAAVASLLPRVQSLAPGEQGDQGQGAIMLVALILLCAGSTLIVARVKVDAPAKSSNRVAGLSRRAWVVALMALAVGGLAAVAALEGSPEARSAGDPTSAARFGSTDSVRYAYWRVALEAFAQDPLKGTGSGGFAVEWRRQPDQPESAVDAHSLYVETLAELGVIGAAFLILFLGGVAAAAARLHRRDPAVAAGPAAACLTWAVHAGLDWDWEIPALTGVALVLAGALVAWEDEPLA